MISFDDIDKYDWQYALYMRYLCLVHNRIYYRNFYILNQENIPPRGVPTLVIANHQNGLMDAMAILHTMFKDQRQPVFIARGDIFKKDRVAKILRFLKIMPTFRTRDGNVDDVRSNLGLFNRAAKVLCDGGTIVIFPEAAHQHGHYMSTFKKGFARIAFAAEEMKDYNLGVKVLPINIHYSNYFTFQSDLMVTIGEPFTFGEFLDMYKENHDTAYHALIDKARARVKELTPDIDIPEYYNEIESLTQMMSDPLLHAKKLRANYLPNQKDAAMTIIAKIKQFKENKPEEFERLMLQTREYQSLLQKTNLNHWVVNRKLHVPAVVLRTLGLLVTLPLFLFGFINNFVPRYVTKHFTDKVKDPMLHSSFQYVIGTLLTFPVWYLLLFAVVWILSKHFWVALLYVLLTLGTAFLVHHYKIHFKKLIQVFRARYIRKTDDYQKLSELNTEIVGVMEQLLF
ncbi:MAG: 1-acyl-sn-glycerol-3-phosphate acyltransferase [Bacteroidales bacterium]|nr:1-acyl-sn-glycerol-3-phosphate acyltransferase [Bacteroidales bacterium]